MSHEKQIKDFFQTNLLSRRADKNISETDNLIELGIIDSLGILRLISFLEEQLNVTIKSEYLVAENFESIQAIIEFVNKELMRN